MKTIDKRLFIGISLTFISLTIIGTLLHEFGHYAILKYFGYNAKISYASTNWIPPNDDASISEKEFFFVALGGPLQSMLTGTAGFLLLLIYRRRYISIEKLEIWQWITIFLSLFWLRQIANILIWLIVYLFTEKFSTNSDEIVIAQYLGLPNWTILSLTALIGLIIILVVYKSIPRKQRLTFILAALTGAIIGSLLWFQLLGEYILP